MFKAKFILPNFSFLESRLHQIKINHNFNGLLIKPSGIGVATVIFDISDPSDIYLILAILEKHFLPWYTYDIEAG